VTQSVTLSLGSPNLNFAAAAGDAYTNLRRRFLGAQSSSFARTSESVAAAAAAAAVLNDCRCLTVSTMAAHW
jgi:hypothetical protein